MLFLCQVCADADAVPLAEIPCVFRTELILGE